MTDSDPGAVDVAALVEERRQYEGWLAALEARRERTPSHVYERVEADYRSRLQRVIDQLTSHRSSLQDERAGIESRLPLLIAEAKLRADEKAELELRCEVGEVAASAVAGALQSLTSTLDQLNVERQNLERRNREIAELMSDHAPPRGATAPRSAPAVDAKPAITPSRTSREAALDEAESHATPVVPHPPIGLRASSATEQTKTLKCAECGGMNYPTEWYCERCGAELAAL